MGSHRSETSNCWAPSLSTELTGLGEDSHRLSSSVNLDSHIDDVAGLLQRENLQGVTLVGHSYAGMVITGVAERESARLSRLIYVDAFVPNNEESALDLLPETIQTSLQEDAYANGEGWRLPASEKLLDLWGLGPGAARDYVGTRLCGSSECRLHAEHREIARHCIHRLRPKKVAPYL